MARKLNVESDIFEGYSLLALVTPMKDYRLAYFLNHTLNLHLKKYNDLKIPGKETGFSWYYFSEGSNYLRYMLISNISESERLISGQPIDFILLIKNIVNNEQLSGILSKIRKISGISAGFSINMLSVKNMEILLEAIEMHETEQIIKPKIKKLKPRL